MGGLITLSKLTPFLFSTILRSWPWAPNQAHYKQILSPLAGCKLQSLGASVSSSYFWLLVLGGGPDASRSSGNVWNKDCRLMALLCFLYELLPKCQGTEKGRPPAAERQPLCLGKGAWNTLGDMGAFHLRRPRLSLTDVCGFKRS